MKNTLLRCFDRQMTKSAVRSPGGNAVAEMTRKQSHISELPQMIDWCGPEAFATFYASQRIVPDSEFNEFVSAVKTPLPTCFVVRVQFPGGAGLRLQQLLQRGAYPEASPIPWYPGQIAYQVIDRNQWSAQFKAIMSAATDTGLIIRQELVSMIPALLITHEPITTDCSIVDLCAAPGSKTSQLVQILRLAQKSPSEGGVVLANDNDANRANMLLSRLRFAGSSALVVSRCDATQFPSDILFDRVVCDVPCGSDGTTRKSPKTFSNWKITQGANLHILQIRIAKRAFLLTKPGGLMSYSTCSFNPIENEAVVVALLEAFSDEIEAVDCSDMLKGLRRSPGLTTWRVYASSRTDGLKEFADIESSKLLPSFSGQCQPTMFPPSTRVHDASLLKCMRLLPHHNDSGGFFIALFRRRQLAVPARALPAALPPTVTGHAERPFVQVMTSENGRNVVELLGEFMKNTFPMERLHHHALSDDAVVGKRARYYLFSHAAYVEAEYHTENMGLIHGGVKVFEQSSHKRLPGQDPELRINWEGLAHVLPHVKPNTILHVIPFDIIKQLLSADETKLSYATWPALRDMFAGRRNGTAIFQALHADGTLISLPGRVNKNSVQLQVPSRACEALQMLFK